jgi:anti-sigma-K factor RskA
MTVNRDDKALAGEYVLGLLEGAARTDVERRIASDAEFAREVEGWRKRLLAFDDATAPGAVSEQLWNKIEAGVPARAVPAGPSAFAKFWSSLAVMRATALGATFAALVLAVGLGFAVKAARQQPVMVAVLLDGSKAGAVVQAFSDGRVVLVPLVDINVPEGRALEVWTLPSRERGPVSVGLMNRARTLALSLKDLPAPGTDQLFEITLEPATGSPTGRPTGPVLFKGNTALAL